MEQIHIDRLQKLADHLLHGKLAHKKFDFSRLNKGGIGNKCGTAGCALGEAPAVWPEDWEWKKDSVRLKHLSDDPLDSGMGWFGINEDEYRHLFIPINQNTRKYGGERLTESATKEEVANNILEFIKIKHNEHATT